MTLTLPNCKSFFPSRIASHFPSQIASIFLFLIASHFAAQIAWQKADKLSIRVPSEMYPYEKKDALKL